jgi:hypothetical protein
VVAARKAVLNLSDQAAIGDQWREIFKKMEA